MSNKLLKYIINNSEIDEVFNTPKSLNYPIVKDSGLSLMDIISNMKQKNTPRLNITANVSIAVVGNSGILLENKLGSEIDKHDLVIRCNLARVKGYEKHVGSRTSIRCIAGKSYWHDLKNKFSAFDTNYIPSLDETIIVKANPLNNAIQGAVRNFNSSNTIHYFNDFFINYCNSLCKSSDVTVGFCAVVLACAFSNQVSTYGFNFFREKDWGKKHYFENITPYQQGHNFVYEAEYFNELNKQGLIKIK